MTTQTQARAWARTFFMARLPGLTVQAGGGTTTRQTRDRRGKTRDKRRKREGALRFMFPHRSGPRQAAVQEAGVSLPGIERESIGNCSQAKFAQSLPLPVQ